MPKISKTLCSIVFLPCLLLIAVPAFGQLTEVGQGDFSIDTVTFDFTGFSNGSRANRIISDWGVLFTEGSFGTPEIKQIFAVGSTNGVVSNTPASGTSANKPLVVDFVAPVRRVGFVLDEFASDTSISIAAFDAEGNLIGEVDKTGLSAPAFIGVASGAAAGISKLLISYGDNQNPEQLDDLRVDFVTRPAYRTFLAQVGDGPLSGSFLQTTIVVSNIANTTTVGELAFFNSAGEPLVLNIGGENSSVFPLEIPPFSSKAFDTSGTSSPVGVGYAQISTSGPVEGTAVFRIVNDDGTVTTEAGVGSNRGTFGSVAAVQKKVEGAFDSGLAVVNTSDQPAQGTIELYSENGNRAGVADLPLAGNSHKASFLSELFPQIANLDFKGTVRVVSDRPLAVVVLRTGAGLVLSSLPVGSLEK